VRTRSPHDPVFQNSLAELASPLHGLPKDEMIGEDVRQRHQRSIIRRTAIAALLLTTSFAVWQLVEARTAQKAVTVRALVLEANAQRSTQPRLSLMLDIAALRLDPMSADGRVSLLAILTENPLTAAVTGHDDSVRGVAWNPDGTRLASASHDHKISMWDTRDPVHPLQQATLTGHTDWVDAVAWSPDGTRLASGSKDRTVAIWNLRDLTHPV
jgi:hypothetical protein